VISAQIEMHWIKTVRRPSSILFGIIWLDLNATAYTGCPKKFSARSLCRTQNIRYQKTIQEMETLDMKNNIYIFVEDQ